MSRVLWVIEKREGYLWKPSMVLQTRVQARRLQEYVDGKTRIRAYVPDPFLNRDHRPSR